MTRFELTLNKRSIKFHIGLGFLGEYQEKFDFDINTLIQKIDKNPWKYIPSMMYESALYASKGKLDFDEDTLLDWIDEDGGFGSKALTDFLSNFMNCLTKGVPKDDTKEADDSKKK